jgi:carbonic anhydrase
MPDKLLEKHQPLAQEFFEERGELLERLSREGQNPRALFIGCSDSRLAPERMLGLLPGEMFMLRNVANIIPPYVQTDMGIVSALEFAVLHLRVADIIVCGHTDCGGIKSLDGQLDLTREPALSRWLDLARPAQRDVDFLLADLEEAERHIAIVERNVVNQLRHIQSYPFVREAMESEQLELRGWVYYLEQSRIGYYDPASDQFRDA